MRMQDRKIEKNMKKTYIFDAGAHKKFENTSVVMIGKIT